MRNQNLNLGLDENMDMEDYQQNEKTEKQKENVKILFNVFETNYVENFVYCVGRTKFIQQPSRA